MDIGKTIQRLRKEKGWSQLRLSREADVSLVTLHQVEQGINQTRTTTFIAIAQGLGMRPSELFREVENDSK